MRLAYTPVKNWP